VLYRAAQELIESADESWCTGLLWCLCYASPDECLSYVNSEYIFGQWHKVRYGQKLLRSLVAFLRVLGIDRVLILVDQVEDFATWRTPSYKLRRDLPRLAYLCAADALLRDKITFVLTMHPHAARVLSWYWPADTLGPMNANGAHGNVVRLSSVTVPRFLNMVGMYLASVRSIPTNDPLHPFTAEALRYVCEREQGRPGYCLNKLHRLLEAAVDQAIMRIDRDQASNLLE
jgi:hypothetical protein